MDYTDNLNLIKPAKAEQFNIDYHNTNSDIIDSAFKDEVDTRLAADTNLQEQIELNRNEERRIGIVPISKGGTGKNTAQDALNALHGSVVEQADISADDEVTFIKRTAEDVSEGTPKSLDVESVKLNALAAKVYELIRGDSAVFSATKNGLVPKRGSASSASYLAADGTWSVPYITDNVVELSASKQILLNVSTTIKITATSQVQLVLDNPTSFGVMLRIMNLSKIAHTLYAESVSSHSSFSILPNANFTIMWNGTAWQNVGGCAVGETFEQKPQCDSPFDVFPCSDWVELISHNGAFYRSANAPTTLYTLDAVNFYADVERLNPVDWSGIKNADGTSGTVSDTGNTITNSRGETVKIYTGSWTSGNADGYIEKSGDLIVQMDAIQKHTHTLSVSGGFPYTAGGYPAAMDSRGNRQSEDTGTKGRFDVETRPINFTVHTWKRVA